MENSVFKNEMHLIVSSKSENEALARVGVAAFLTKADPTLEEMNDIKTAVSEAVTNSIIHGYGEEEGNVEIECHLEEKTYEKNKEKIEKVSPNYESCEADCSVENVVRVKEIVHKTKLIITVRDEGKGIENVEKAMEPMFTTMPECDRAGMGFAFMQLFMDDVYVWSKKNIGTIVTMTKELKRTEIKEQNECNKLD